LPIDIRGAIPIPKSRPGIVFLGWDGRSAAVNDHTIADAMHPVEL
jgi:hypothetical protein